MSAASPSEANPDGGLSVVRGILSLSLGTGTRLRQTCVMSDSEWVVRAGEAGVRLDKYLAAPGRLGSRARAFAGLERGKVFVNAHEVGVADAATPLAAGQTVRVRNGRPGSPNPPPSA